MPTKDEFANTVSSKLREAELRGFPGSDQDSIIVSRDLDELSEELGIKRNEADDVIGRLIRVGIAKPVTDGIEVASIARLNEFLSFLEERGIVQS